MQYGATKTHVFTLSFHMEWQANPTIFLWSASSKSSLLSFLASQSAIACPGQIVFPMKLHLKVSTTSAFSARPVLCLAFFSISVFYLCTKFRLMKEQACKVAQSLHPESHEI